MISLSFIKGDATSPQAKGRKIIAHICNDLGKWGKGFVMAVSARWTALRPKRRYTMRTFSILTLLAACLLPVTHATKPATDEQPLIPTTTRFNILHANQRLWSHSVSPRLSSRLLC